MITEMLIPMKIGLAAKLSRPAFVYGKAFEASKKLAKAAKAADVSKSFVAPLGKILSETTASLKFINKYGLKNYNKVTREIHQNPNLTIKFLNKIGLDTKAFDDVKQLVNEATILKKGVKEFRREYNKIASGILDSMEWQKLKGIKGIEARKKIKVKKSP